MIGQACTDWEKTFETSAAILQGSHPKNTRAGRLEPRVPTREGIIALLSKIMKGCLIQEPQSVLLSEKSQTYKMATVSESRSPLVRCWQLGRCTIGCWDTEKLHKMENMFYVTTVPPVQ